MDINFTNEYYDTELNIYVNNNDNTVNYQMNDIEPNYTFESIMENNSSIQFDGASSAHEEINATQVFNENDYQNQIIELPIHSNFNTSNINSSIANNNTTQAYIETDAYLNIEVEASEDRAPDDFISSIKNNGSQPETILQNQPSDLILTELVPNNKFLSTLPCNMEITVEEEPQLLSHNIILNETSNDIVMYSLDMNNQTLIQYPYLDNLSDTASLPIIESNENTNEAQSNIVINSLGSPFSPIQFMGNNTFPNKTYSDIIMNDTTASSANQLQLFSGSESPLIHSQELSYGYTVLDVAASSSLPSFETIKSTTMQYLDLTSNTIITTSLSPSDQLEYSAATKQLSSNANSNTNYDVVLNSSKGKAVELKALTIRETSHSDNFNHCPAISPLLATDLLINSSNELNDDIELISSPSDITDFILKLVNEPLSPSTSLSNDILSENDSTISCSPSTSSASISLESPHRPIKKRGRPRKTDDPILVLTEEDLKNVYLCKHKRMRHVNNISSRRARQTRHQRDLELENTVITLENENAKLKAEEKQIRRKCDKWQKILMRLQAI